MKKRIVIILTEHIRFQLKVLITFGLEGSTKFDKKKNCVSSPLIRIVQRTVKMIDEYRKK